MKRAYLMKPKFFRSASHFQRWLLDNHNKLSELWVGFYKKASGKPSITYPQSVDEALCFGWIDGVRRSVNTLAYAVRFTPRKPKSQWSAVNIKRVRALMDAGRMRSPGLQAFEGARSQVRAYSYEQRHQARFQPADERRFRANRTSWEYFQKQPAWYRRTATFWVVSAKKEETRAKRLAALIADSARGKPIKPLARPSVPKRQ